MHLGLATCYAGLLQTDGMWQRHSVLGAKAVRKEAGQWLKAIPDYNVQVCACVCV